MPQFSRALSWALSHIPIRYLIAGGASFLVNFAIFYLCHRLAGMWYVYATIVAGTCAWMLNFPLHKLWTFGDYRRGAIRLQAPAHFLLKLLNTYASDPLLLYLLVEYLGISPLWAKAFIGAMLGLQNYVLCRYVIFRPSP